MIQEINYKMNPIKQLKVNINSMKRLTVGQVCTIIKDSDIDKTKDKLCIVLGFIEKECKKWTQYKENTLVLRTHKELTL